MSGSRIASNPTPAGLPQQYAASILRSFRSSQSGGRGPFRLRASPQPLLDLRQRDQRQSRPPVAVHSRSRPSVKRLLRLRRKASAETRQQLSAATREDLLHDYQGGLASLAAGA